MASTLALPPPSDPLLAHSPDAPPPSQDFAMHQVPHVFVIPPEEEQEHNPPWCYFDAAAVPAHALATDPDIDTLDVALGLCQQLDNRAPSFGRHHPNSSQETVVMPLRGSTLPRLNEVDLAMEDGQTDIRSRSRSETTGSGRHRTYDEDVVEVVKVRRNEGMADVGDRTLKLKKSSTFRVRASQALRSIKNVGKGARRASASESKPKPVPVSVPTPATVHGQPHAVAETLPTRHSYQDAAATPAKAKSPTMSRRRSLTLSQMFAFKESSKENQRAGSSSRPASPLAPEEPPLSPTPTVYDVPPNSARPMSPTDVADSHAERLRPSPSLEDCMATPTRSLPSRSLSPALNSKGDGDEEDASKPTLSKRKSFRRRLSVLELQKLFSIGTGGGSSNSHAADLQQAMKPSTPEPTQDMEEDLFSPTSATHSQARARGRPLSMDSAGILSSASSASRTSTASLGQMSSRPSYSSQRSAGSAPKSGTDAGNVMDADDDGAADADADLEMRLDSLHFDSLHFDPDEIMSLTSL
ncbi:hypothetical protein C8Q77DRAFT_1155080 [Trametes polyzona]|nr:hypothetical protein C8Q77DRAFT_1155080 [Trametes polyzona]